ncbi:hypothetical protein LUTEI9C_140058 [Luteimonas sp. 9C]|nr:hypothetical protein LUTEI9C_140058 [Luteimonas sp. 9C]
MRGREFRWRLAATGFGHALPQRHRFARIEARGGGQHQADVVGFGLVLARVGQQVAVAHRGHDHLLLLRVHAAHRAGHLADLGQLLLGHALGAVTQQGVGDLVAHHDGQRIGVLRDRNQAGVDGHLAARQTERVGLVGFEHVDFPVEALREPRGFQPVLPREFGLDHVDLGDQALGDQADLFRDLAVGIDGALLAEDFLVGLEAQRLLLIDIERAIDQHGLAGDRVDALVGEVVVRAVAREQQQDDEAHAEAAPRRATGLTTVTAAEWILSHLVSPEPVARPVVKVRALRGSRVWH